MDDTLVEISGFYAMKGAQFGALLGVPLASFANRRYIKYPKQFLSNVGRSSFFATAIGCLSSSPLFFYGYNQMGRDANAFYQSNKALIRSHEELDSFVLISILYGGVMGCGLSLGIEQTRPLSISSSQVLLLSFVRGVPLGIFSGLATFALKSFVGYLE